MASAQRVSDEPAFILHRYDWSESSLILEVFTRHRGRVALVAKGAKKHTSNFRPVLLGLQPLRLSYTLAGSSSADIHTLRGAEWAGGHIMPMGARLLSGLYINELLLRLLARDDPYAYVFDVYAALIKLLATQHDVVQEPALRAFELILLRELGLLPSLHAPTVSHLYDRDWLALETVVDNHLVRDLIPRLTTAGAQGILEYELKKMV